MPLATFLSVADEDRLRRTLGKLGRHEIAPLVLTGGVAIELHMQRLGAALQPRPLNDIDFVVDRFDQIPTTLAADFLFRHVHPYDPPNKTLVQAADPETSLRVDIFRACGASIAQAISPAISMDVCGPQLRVLSVEDLAARAARLSLDLAEGRAMPAKHARDFLRLLPLVDSAAIETAWRDHRKEFHPATFDHASRILRVLTAQRPELQINQIYGLKPPEPCTRCHATEHFPLPADRVTALLGYS